MSERKYSIAEIDRMRQSLRSLNISSGTPYYEKEVAAKVEDQLRTHMQNGTDPEELAKAASEKIGRECEEQRREQEFYEKRRKNTPPPRVLKTKDDVIDEWFQTCVAQYEGASETASNLYDGFSGKTLKSFANRHAPDGINIGRRDMERFLKAKGIKARNAMFAKRYDGIQHIIHGNVRSGNYGT